MTSTEHSLGNDEDLNVGIHRLCRRYCSLATGHIHKCSSGTRSRQVESIHEARKALKRLRALLRIAMKLNASSKLEKADRLARKAGRLIAGQRELDVSIDLVVGLRTNSAATLRTALSGVAAGLQSQREKLQECGSHLQAAEAVTQTDGLLTTWMPTTIQVKDFTKAIRRDYRRARREFRSIATQLKHRKSNRSTRSARELASHLHALRRKLKRLMYLIEFSRGLTSPKLRRFARRLSELEECLGQHHDHWVLVETITAKPGPYGGRNAVRTASRELRNKLHELEAKLPILARKTFRLRPKKLGRKLDRILM